MKTPTWATVIGVLMVIFGGCGAVNDIRSIAAPEAIARGKEEIERKKAEKAAAKADTTKLSQADTLTSNSGDTVSGDAEDEKEEIPFFGKKSPEEIMTLSEFSEKWIVRFGYIGAACSLLYLIAGIFLMVRRTFSIKLAYAALVISILSAGMQTAVLTSTAAADVMSKVIGLTSLPGILIDIILLAVIFASDKDAYKEENLSR